MSVHVSVIIAYSCDFSSAYLQSEAGGRETYVKIQQNFDGFMNTSCFFKFVAISNLVGEGVKGGWI